MEGNSITSFENLCRIFEMRINLDREKGVKTSPDVISNYEKYSKKIDEFYNIEFQKELKHLISPAVTLEKEEDRLKRLIKLLEDRLSRRIELEDKFYSSTGRYISGLQLIVSEAELEDKKERLSLISNYLETSREIDNVTDSLNKLRDLLNTEEEKKSEYETKNKIMEDELYSTFMNVIKDSDYENIKEEDIDNELEQIRSKVSETEETLDITRESVGSLITSGLEDDYSSYIEEAERNYFNYKNKELILKIYKLVITFEEEFKLICAKREKIDELLEEKKNLKESLSIETNDELLPFENTLLLQSKSLDNEREVLENITNYISRIKFKEERLEELNELNNSAQILSILREYGLVETYDTDDITNDITEDSIQDNMQDMESPLLEESVSEVVYDPYRIVEVKDYPKTLNVGLAKLKGESVREKVNKKLNPKADYELVSDLPSESLENSNILIDNNNASIDEATLDTNVVENRLEEATSLNLDIPNVEDVKTELSTWKIPTETQPNTLNFENQDQNNLSALEMVKPSFDIPEILNNNEQISDINITSIPIDENNSSINNNLFWVPVTDSKMETNDFPNINIPINNDSSGNSNFSFPTINN